jgi:hypothetical protein
MGVVQTKTNHSSCSPVATVSDTIFAEDAKTFIIYKNLMRERNCICGSAEELGSTVGYFVLLKCG